MSGMTNSQSARLFFWFLWLSGFVFGFFLIGQFVVNIVVHGNAQKGIPFFMGFVWQCGVQLGALKIYQNSMRMREPLLIQLGGSLALVFIVVFVFVSKS